jgi:hypothetical protein
MKRYGIVGTPTPTDGWSSYFDSWRTEDTEVPTFEPLIQVVDDELHPDLSNLRFNMDMDMEVDWDMDMQSPYVSAMHSNGKTKLNVAHPDYQRHGLQRHDVDAWERPWLGRANDDVGCPLGPLHQIQIGAGAGVGVSAGMDSPGPRGPRVQHQQHHHQHPHRKNLGVRQAFKVKVSTIWLPHHLHHHSPSMASLHCNDCSLVFSSLPHSILVPGFQPPAASCKLDLSRQS